MIRHDREEDPAERDRYIGQIMKDAGVISYKELKDMANNKRNMEKKFVVNKFLINQYSDLKKKCP